MLAERLAGISASATLKVAAEADRLRRAGVDVVDLGAGDCCKAQAWLPFLDASRYIAVDIAGAEIESALARMAPDFPEVEMVGVVACSRNRR